MFGLFVGSNSLNYGIPWDYWDYFKSTLILYFKIFIFSFLQMDLNFSLETLHSHRVFKLSGRQLGLMVIGLQGGDAQWRVRWQAGHHLPASPQAEYEDGSCTPPAGDFGLHQPLAQPQY